MSWLDDINTPLKVTTGDGVTYSPNWLNASIDKEWNISEFQFPEVSGTLAVRFLPMGRRLNLELYFQGDNHLDVWKNFDKSADDTRPWVISHPFYERIIVQPISMKTDHSQYNVSKVMVVVVETITDEKPTITTNPQDRIKAISANLYAKTTVAISPLKPKPKDVPNLKNKTNKLYNIGKARINNNLDLSKYYNFYSDLNSKISLFTSFPIQAMSALQTFINYPSQFANTIESRFDMMENQFDALFGPFDTKNDKTIYEFSGAALIGSMAEATITGATYSNAASVLSIMTRLLDNYNTFISNLDAIQSSVNNSIDSYLPDAESMSFLRDLINFTASQLFNIALNSKQERTFVCDSDTNVVLLAHRLYGLLEDDSSIDQIINDNKIGISEMLQIKKGRAIIYYV